MEDEMLKSMLDSIDKKYKLKEIDTGEYKNCKCGVMKVQVSQYEAKNLGNVSIIEGKAMAGLMKMKTLIISPFNVDMPLLSFDFINAMGKITLFLELYDTHVTSVPSEDLLKPLNAEKQSLSIYNDNDLGKHWYDYMKLSPTLSKHAKKSDIPTLDKVSVSYINEYIKLSEKMPIVDEVAKKAVTKKYVDGLFDNGGPATDQFRKGMGEEKTRDLFARIIFGVK